MSTPGTLARVGYVYVGAMTTYRFLDGMGDVVADGDFADHETALEWASGVSCEEDVQRVEYLGPGGDWRWAGALHG